MICPKCIVIVLPQRVMVEKGEEISDLSPLLQIKTAIQKLKVVH